MVLEPLGSNMGEERISDVLVSGCLTASVLAHLGVCHCAIFFTHFLSFLTPFPLHFSYLFHSVPRIFTPHHHSHFPSFPLPFLKTQTEFRTTKKTFN